MRLRRKAARILSVSASTDLLPRLPAGSPALEWSIVLTDDDQLRQLNATYRGKNSTTDVLSFALADDRHPYLLGDVVVSVEQAARQATAIDDRHRGGALEAEIVRLLVHGLCHLCGHDHGQAGQRREMRAAERRLLEPLGLSSML